MARCGTPRMVMMMMMVLENRIVIQCLLAVLPLMMMLMLALLMLVKDVLAPLLSLLRLLLMVACVATVYHGACIPCCGSCSWSQSVPFLDSYRTYNENP